MTACLPLPVVRLALVLVALCALLALAAGTARGATVTVAPGDTLGAIAARHGTTATALASANGIANPDLIAAGARLAVPGDGSGVAAPSGGGSYRVRSGDTLAAIAARHGTTAAALASANGIANPDLIAAGALLTVPAGAPAAPEPSGGEDVAGLLHASAARHGIDPAVARAVAWQESRWRQGAVSSAGAVGVMQLLPSTARWFGPAVLGRRLNPRRVEDNIEGGVAYLGWLTRQSGSTRRALAAYYQGLTSLRRRGPYDDTKDYVASVLSFVGRV
jgi:soluble lytic murein transglycosylase-like protein